VRERLRRQILEVLGGYEHPLTVSSTKQLIDRRSNGSCSWHTVRKYLDELAGERLVLRQALPADGRQKPLVVYLGRCWPNRQLECSEGWK